MTAKDAAEPRASTPHTEPRRVYVAWSLARVFVACIVVVAAATAEARSTESLAFTSPRVLNLLALVALATALAMGIAMVARRDIEWSAPYIVSLDTLLVAGMVYVTGGPSSPLAALFGANVLVSALTIGPRAPYPLAVASVTVFGVIAVGLSSGVLPPPRDQVASMYALSAPELGLALASTSTGLLLVSLLAHTLANRLFRTGGALEYATRAAEALAQRNSDIVRSLSSGLLTTDLEGRIDSANEAARAILGRSAHELLGQPVGALLPLPSTDARAGEVARSEGIALRGDGSSFPVGLTLTRLRGAAGEHQGTLVSFIDLTEIRRLEDAARSAEQLAALGRIAAGLAHEIRNPLSSISGSVELVRESPALVPEESRLLGIVLAEAERLDELVRTMLDFAKPRRPRPQLSEMLGVVREIAQMAELGVAGKAGVNVLVEAAPGITAEVDPDQLRQVIWNLLKNAVQASSEGQRVWIRVTESSDEVTLEVRDEGKGLGPGASEDLFEMFRTGHAHGMGIGLALVKRIVDGHGGTIRAYNLEPRGACVRVVLPKESALSGRSSLESIP